MVKRCSSISIGGTYFGLDPVGTRIWELVGQHGSLQKVRSTDGSLFDLEYADGTRFWVSASGSDVWASWPGTSTPEDAATYLLGPVLGFVLRLRGVTCLHASAVEVDGRAVAFLGPADAGKSTTASAFAARGHPVLSDDVSAITEDGQGFLVESGYPCLRLRPQTVAMLYGSEDALPLMTSTWDRRYIDLTRGGYRFHEGPLPLAAVYLLGVRQPGARPPLLRRISARDRLMALVGNGYVSYLLDRTMRAREFDLLAKLAVSVFLRPRVFLDT